MADKVIFSKAVGIQPVYKGIYKDPKQDLDRFVVVAKRKVVKETGDTVQDNLARDTESIDAQLCFGWANVTINEDGTMPFDWQGDGMETEVLEAAAYNYVLNQGLANQEHEFGTDCGYVIESMMFTKEKMQALGIPEGTLPEGWFIGFYIPDTAVYEKVKNGEYNMFSIEGRAQKISASIEEVANNGLFY